MKITSEWYEVWAGKKNAAFTGLKGTAREILERDGIFYID